MSATADHDRISGIFYEALQLPPAQREEFLSQACAGDARLRAEVEALLASAVEIPELLETGALATRIQAAAERPPASVGTFEIVAKLGEGGMGVVYRAVQQQPIRREVAIKLIRRGFETARVLARFESERQALALMNHPCIAHVVEAGVTADGRPYIVMEYVDGEPITTYCDRNRLSLGERLDLFMEVCAALQHAHHKAIIHRDLKPSNVLVTTGSGRPLPKVIDFGVAKALEHRSSEESLRTEFGQLVGTPEYMSPEQAAMDDRAIDTRTDIYSLGVLLYELLTGERPFGSEELRRRGPDEARRLIRECDPPRPSSRVQGARSRQLRGDLDWITMRALEKEPARRYASAGELAEDIARSLRREPVVASPPGRVYRLQRFVGKHRVGVAFACVLVLLLAGIAVAATVQARRFASERNRADAAAQQAMRKAAAAVQASDFLVGVFDLAEDRQAARRLLDAARHRIDVDYGSQSAERARVLFPLGRIYDSLGFAEGVSMMGQALEDLRRALGPDDPEVLALMFAQAKRTSAAGDHAGAATMMVDVLALRRESLGSDHRETLETLAWLARMQEKSGRFSEADGLLREARARALERFGADDPTSIRVLAYTAELRRRQLRLDEAERGYREVIASLERTRAPWTSTLSCVYKLGCVRAQQGDREEAVALIKRALDGGWFYALTEGGRAPTHLALREEHGLLALHGHPGFEALIGPDSALVALDHARDAAWNRRFDEALRHLQTAVGRGVDDPDVLLRDPQLQPLLTQSGFLEIVAELRARRAA